jgi:GxxExxY protein
VEVSASLWNNLEMIMYYEKELSDKIIKACYSVYDTLGHCFLEKVYEKALIVELKEFGLELKSQYPIEVDYKDVKVGEFYADILVANKIILELKSCKYLDEIHQAQLLNYLKATKVKVGYLINFGNIKNLEYKRLIY